MIAADEGALECDLAETYGILEHRSLGARKLATLAAGLRENSRIKSKLSGQAFPHDTLLLASAVDMLSLLWWAQTEDGQHGQNRPASVLRLFTGEAKTPAADDILCFDSATAFEAAFAAAQHGGDIS